MKRILTNAILALTFLFLTTSSFAGGQLYRSQKSLKDMPPASAVVQSSISRAMVTTRIEEKEPISNLVRVESTFSMVYVFMEMVNCVGCEFEHHYYFNGELITIAEGTAAYPRYRWWSKLSMTQEDIGNWTVKILVNGVVERELDFEYYQPTLKQRRTQDIQTRIEHHSVEECRRNLEYFQQKHKENPDELYFQFMFERWGERCL